MKIECGPQPDGVQPIVCSAKGLLVGIYVRMEREITSGDDPDYMNVLKHVRGQLIRHIVSEHNPIPLPEINQ